MDSPFVRPDVQAFLDYINAAPGGKLSDLSPEEARMVSNDMCQLASVPVGELAVIRNYSCKGPGGEIPLRLFDARANRERGPVLIFFHGGGFVLGDLDTHAPFCAEAARQLDLPVIAVDYRLAPEHPFPAGPLDCEAAARWVGASPPELGFEVTGLALCGDSAGGMLSIITSMALRDKPAGVPLLAQFPIYPVVDLKNRYRSNETFAEGYFLGDSEISWFFNYYAADVKDWRGGLLIGSQASMPPTLILTAGLDPLRDQGRRYAKACIEQGVSVTYREAAGNIHGFITLTKAIPSAAGDVREGLALFKNMIRHQCERIADSMSEGRYGR